MKNIGKRALGFFLTYLNMEEEMLRVTLYHA
jgi:hypothetical protein